VEVRRGLLPQRAGDGRAQRTQHRLHGCGSCGGAPARIAGLEHAYHTVAMGAGIHRADRVRNRPANQGRQRHCRHAHPSKERRPVSTQQRPEACPMPTESLPQVTSLRPRHYAKAYLKAQGRDAQRAALKGCPVEWQDLVRLHIAIRRQKRGILTAAKGFAPMRKHSKP
jgi:hypothetical protein